jgi:hypothetical protein
MNAWPSQKSRLPHCGDAKGRSSVWVMEWLQLDERSDGCRPRRLTAFDAWTPLRRVIRASPTPTPEMVVDVLEEVHREFGLPHAILVGGAREFTSTELKRYLVANGIAVINRVPVARERNAQVDFSANRDA